MGCPLKTDCRRRPSSFFILAVLAFCLVLLFLAVPVTHADYTASETLSSFGTLHQPAWPNSRQDPNTSSDSSAFYDCTQTALVNAFVYLQETYGTALVPSYKGNRFNAYPSMDAAAKTLNTGLYTDPGHYVPTTWTRKGFWLGSEHGGNTVASGTYNYVSKTAGISTTYFYAETHGSSSWAANAPDHAFGIGENPTEAFLYNGLALGDAVLINWNNASSNQWHWLILTGISFDPATGAGTISWIDPQNPAKKPAYSAKISINQDGTIGFHYSTTGWYSGDVSIINALVFGPNQTPSMDSPVSLP
jgi:hypothetical protein